MKIRTGFVSNSSSSSFVILVKDTKMTRDELYAKTLDVFEKEYGKKEVYEEYLKNKINKVCDESQYIYCMMRVPYGGEEAAENIVNFFMEKLGLDYEGKWES